LTCEDVDIIVNAANNQLRHSGGLSAAIVSKGGDKIQDDCDTRIKKKGALEDGDIFTTKGYDLPCKYVIHAVGPSWKGGKYKEKKSFEKTCEKSIKGSRKKEGKKYQYSRNINWCLKFSKRLVC